MSVSQLGKSLFQSSLSFPSDISASSTHCRTTALLHAAPEILFLSLSLNLAVEVAAAVSIDREKKEAK